MRQWTCDGIDVTVDGIDATVDGSDAMVDDIDISARRNRRYIATAYTMGLEYTLLVR